MRVRGAASARANYAAMEHAEPQRIACTLADLRSAFARTSFLRGESYADDGRVQIVEIAPAGDAIIALVRGSRPLPYHVSVAIRKRAGVVRIHGSCECPMREGCKHAAAAVMVALRRASGEAAVPREHATDPRVAFWLERLERACDAPVAVAENERIVYRFVEERTPSDRTFPVEIVAERQFPSGWKFVQTLRADSLASAQGGAATVDDIAIGQQLLAYASAQRNRERFGGDLAARILLTGRAFLGTGRAGRTDVPLWRGRERNGRVEWTVRDDGMHVPVVRDDNGTIRLLPGADAWYVDPTTGEVGPLATGLTSAVLRALLSAPPLAPGAIDAVRTALANLANRSNTSGASNTSATKPSQLPIPMRERIVRGEPIPVVTLRTIQPARSDLPTWMQASAAEAHDIATLAFAYGDVLIEPDAAAVGLRAITDGVVTTTTRDALAEHRAFDRLFQFGLARDPQLARALRLPATVLAFPARENATWAAFLRDGVPALRADGWRIAIDPTFRQTVVDLGADTAWRAKIVESVPGWFDITIGFEHEGHTIDLVPVVRELAESSGSRAELLARLDRDEPFDVRLPDGVTTLAFPARRLRGILATLVELGESGSADADEHDTDTALRMPLVRAGMLHELESATALRWEAPTKLRLVGEALATMADRPRVPMPAGFRGELRPYQRDGLDWLQTLATYGFGGILADDMGLGKSVQTLAHLLCEREAGRLARPALLIVPTSLVYGWCDEAARFAPTLRVLPLHGPKRAERFIAIGACDLAITTYALLARDTILHEREWSTVIFDEAQMLKNPRAKAAQIASALTAAHRLCLTGTPVENHLGDLWSLLGVAVPGILGDRKNFARVFRTPIEKNGDTARGEALARRIRPFVLRRTKDAVARELPEKTEIVQRAELTGGQRELYETIRLAMQTRVREEIARNGIARSQIVILDALLKLRQVCCDPRLVPERVRNESAKPGEAVAGSAKLAMLLEMLPQLVEEGRRVLLFSQFTSMLDLLAPELAARGIPYVMLTGTTVDRASVVARFQSGEVPVFLISLKAGGTGLNLTQADTVIHYDPWWNPAVERQATDRAHRIGQLRRVFVYKLVCAGTVEETIVALQARKAKLAAAIFSGESGAATRFEAADVERFFAPLGP